MALPRSCKLKARFIVLVPVSVWAPPLPYQDLLASARDHRGPLGRGRADACAPIKLTPVPLVPRFAPWEAAGILPQKESPWMYFTAVSHVELLAPRPLE